jgi:hypothetical protein
VWTLKRKGGLLGVRLLPATSMLVAVTALDVIEVCTSPAELRP